MTPTSQPVTQALDAAASGDPSASEALLPLVYEELRRLAQQRLAHEGPGLTLQPTALVHEAYLRLIGETPNPVNAGAGVGTGTGTGAATQAGRWNSRGHFFAAAAHAMRRILIERARRVASLKHGGAGDGGPARSRLDLDVVDQAATDGFTIGVDEQHEQLVQLDHALQRLEKRDPRKAEVVMLRYFAGLSIAQTAVAMNLSPATVKNEWRFARAWLHSEMERGDGESNKRRD